MTSETDGVIERDADLLVALGHRFDRPELLLEALTHPSTTGGAGQDGPNYERLEFLGDRVLGLVLADILLKRYGGEREGALARRHADLVRRETLAAVARSMRLGPHIRLSKGESAGGGRENAAILADCCEAVIAALFLDGGLEAAARFIEAQWSPLLAEAGAPPVDAKTELQEWAQERGLPLPAYQTVSSTGPDHKPTFSVEASVEGLPAVAASGGSKRAAEQAAAAELLRLARGADDG